MFEDDIQINNFLTLQHEFAVLNIDNDGASQSQILKEEKTQPMSPRTANQILCPTIFDKDNIQIIQKISHEEITDIEEEIINLKDNFMPRGLTPLEDIFDSNDVPKKPKM